MHRCFPCTAITLATIKNSSSKVSFTDCNICNGLPERKLVKKGQRDLSSLLVSDLFILHHISRRSLWGSSTTSLIRRKKYTASLPSISLWSYVSATYIIGLGTTLPPTTIGRCTIECIPSIADYIWYTSSALVRGKKNRSFVQVLVSWGLNQTWGGLMIGVLMRLP